MEGSEQLQTSIILPLENSLCSWMDMRMGRCWNQSGCGGKKAPPGIAYPGSLSS